MDETRKVIDCRRFPAEKPCSIVISGTEDDIRGLAVLHATTVHGHEDTLICASRSAPCSRTRTRQLKPQRSQDYNRKRRAQRAFLN
jgi:hypothetical protein